jgi:hypothetical protein
MSAGFGCVEMVLAAQRGRKNKIAWALSSHHFSSTTITKWSLGKCRIVSSNRDTTSSHAGTYCVS